MHWFRMPPSSLSRSRISRSSTPCRRASMAAARPAGPPPMMTRSTFFIVVPPSQCVFVDAQDDPGRPARFGDLGQGDTQLPCQDLHDPRAAETRLAAAHPGAGPPFDPVQAAGPGHPVDGVEDLALGDALAPADDLPVGGVLPDQGGPLFQREGL